MLNVSNLACILKMLLSKIHVSPVESQKGVITIQHCSIQLYKVYGVCALLVPNGTSLKSINALLVVSHWHIKVFLKRKWISFKCRQAYPTKSKITLQDLSYSQLIKPHSRGITFSTSTLMGPNSRRLTIFKSTVYLNLLTKIRAK